MSIDLSQLPAATGYSTTEVYYGTRFVQGGRTNYLLDLSIMQVLSLIPRPNPEVPTEDNRRITAKHAADFATYMRDTMAWVVPALLLHTDKPFDFKPATGAEAGVAFGALSFPRTATQALRIVDGQHRILGWYIALDNINAALEKIREHIKRAQRNGDENAVSHFEAEKWQLESRAKVFGSEHVVVQVVVEPDPAKYRQLFYDIAENAKGITASVRARFDQTKAVNRALEEVLRAPLLENRTEKDADRLSKISSPMLTTVKYVSETVRALTVGYEGRIGKRIEAGLDHRVIISNAKAFFELLTRAFPPLWAVEHGQLTPDQLRATSMLGQPVFWRILAATHFELTTEHAFSRGTVQEFFTKLAPHLEVPVHENSLLWEQIGPPSFMVGMSAPSSRRQDAVAVVDTFVGWAIEKPAFLDEAPKPRPEPEPEPDAEEMSDEEADVILRPETHRARQERASKTEVN